jgi:deoxyribonucleoside regulator
VMSKNINNEQMSKSELLERVARLYYVLGLSQQEIADQLGVGRSSVARFLAEARERGVIQFHINSGTDRWRAQNTEAKLMKAHRLRDCVVFKTGADSGMSFETLTANYLDTVLPFEGAIGLGWGRTLYSVGRHMHMCDSRPQLRVVQLSGGSGAKEHVAPASSNVQLWAQSLGAQPFIFPAPAIAITPEAKDMFLSDASIQAVISEIHQVNVAIVGIGNVANDAIILISKLVPGLTQADLARYGVGDVIFHFFDADGKFSYPDLSQRVIGASVEEFLKIPLKIAIAYGEAKIDAIHGALRGNLIDVLITDESTAVALEEKSV